MGRDRQAARSVVAPTGHLTRPLPATELFAGWVAACPSSGGSVRLAMRSITGRRDDDEDVYLDGLRRRCPGVNRVLQCRGRCGRVIRCISAAAGCGRASRSLRPRKGTHGLLENGCSEQDKICCAVRA